MPAYPSLVTHTTKASFIPPMLLGTDKLPQKIELAVRIEIGRLPLYAFKTGGKVYLRSRNNKDFTASTVKRWRSMKPVVHRSVLSRTTDWATS